MQRCREINCFTNLPVLVYAFDGLHKQNFRSFKKTLSFRVEVSLDKYFVILTVAKKASIIQVNIGFWMLESKKKRIINLVKS